MVTRLVRRWRVARELRSALRYHACANCREAGEGVAALDRAVTIYQGGER